MTHTKTYQPLIAKAAAALGKGLVIHHPPTETNLLGQSGVHTLVEDIQDVVELVYNNPRIKDEFKHKR